MALADYVFRTILLNIRAVGVAGMALGMVMQLPDQDDETSVSRRQLLAKLDVCMGGRVAEELIFGESNITTGLLRMKTIAIDIVSYCAAQHHLEGHLGYMCDAQLLACYCIHQSGCQASCQRFQPLCVAAPVVSVLQDDGCDLVGMTQGCKCIPIACSFRHVLRQLHRTSLLSSNRVPKAGNVDMVSELGGHSCGLDV